MNLLLILVPALAALSAIFLYRHNGKREILKFDLVQFIYAFIISPLLLVWLKSFFFILLRNELGSFLSLTQLFAADTAFTILLMYIYSFVVVHSLTASFKLKKVSDPLYDVFYHSEYFHLWLSHIVMYGGGMGLISILGLTNLTIPLTLTFNRAALYVTLGLGIIIGIASFGAIWLGNPKQANFMRIMKLFIAFFFVLHAVMYFGFDPDFSIKYGLYWLSFMIFTTMSAISLFADRSERTASFFDWFKYKQGWDFRVELFKNKK